MKSVQQLSHQLANQWLSPDHREQRLLAVFDWPIKLAIGKPSAKIFIEQSSKVQRHLTDWRKQKHGRVEWRKVKYQSASEPVDMPIFWLIDNLDEWIIASDDTGVKKECKQLNEILSRINALFHRLIIRHRSLWANKNSGNSETLINTCQLAMLLEPGMAMGRPLRGLSITGFDSKYLENQRGLLIQLLNIRFDRALQGQNLETFLGASDKGEHWLLLKPLVKGLFPFEQFRLRATELAKIELPVQNLIIVENEQCHYQLPELKNTLAILGGGLNLTWLANTDFNHKNIIYWGDIDTWGLKMLAIARGYQPQLQALLMDYVTYENYKHFAVTEPTNAGVEIPNGLTSQETKLYQSLLHSPIGRLEQERLPSSLVRSKLLLQIR